MKISFLLTFIIFFFSSNAFSTNIRVIDFKKILENNINLTLLYDEIYKDQKIHKLQFKNEELNLQKELERIEKLNLILNANEIEKEFNNYNDKLNNFNIKIDKFNSHYEIQINNLKNKLIDLILEASKKFSEENKIDLILDSSNYILSSNSINITDIISDKINNEKIEINFEKY